MALDGITVRAMACFLRGKLVGGSISKIVESDKDQILMTVKSQREQLRLLLSAAPSLPLLFLEDENRPAPMTAPNFCMFLRKHIQGGRITAVTQPSLERAVTFEIAHRNELGDMVTRRLILELMGKYSNLILTDEDGTIMDAIRHVPSSVSSVREVLPGRPYFLPGAGEKADPLTASKEDFLRVLAESPKPLPKALYTSFTGLSPVMAEELVYEAGLEPRKTPQDLSAEEKDALASSFSKAMQRVNAEDFAFEMYLEDGSPKDYACLPLSMYAGLEKREFPTANGLVRAYYGRKEESTRMKVKSQDLRHAVTTLLSRTEKKLALQEKQLKDTEGRDKYRLYGELLLASGYGIPEGASSAELDNYYTGEKTKVSLDPNLTPAENAQKYYAKYNKQKRTASALEVQIEETRADLEQLTGCLTAVDMAESVEDLAEIRSELSSFGFMKKGREASKGKKKQPAKAKPRVYKSSDGFLMAVGRNNLQNEEVTFKIGGNEDWWFHASKIPGSHVIVKTSGRELTDRAFEEAGSLAAYYSSGRDADKVEIDYTKRRNVKKAAGGKPGFVIYHTHYSLMAKPGIEALERVE